MLLRRAVVLVAVLSLALFSSGVEAKDKDKKDTKNSADKAKAEVHMGSLVKIDKNKKSITITNKKDGEKTYDLADSLTVKFEGKEAKLSDIAKGDPVRIKLDDHQKVMALTKIKPSDKAKSKAQKEKSDDK